ncbi:glycosyltransferase family 4 protein [Oenococcus oeni]|uniref:glycosyltransferase family 4 protein n=1 Tax=Oenococcus oeni TaxID=1247 RepID=UPI0010B54A9E|nr:glycosyltransferase family 4 protein [Oenococcus oeni]SYW14870.1 conserved hypothetical protein [Oenococcus oeni]
MKISIVMRFHDNTASGGRKIVYDYANYLVSRGHEVEIIFEADTFYKLRKLNILKHLGHFLDFVRRAKQQLTITWFSLDKRVLLKTCYSTKRRMFDHQDVILAFDYGIALELFEKKVNADRLVYLIQHDEQVYNEERIVRAAWRLPIQKIVVATWLLNLVKKIESHVVLVKNYVRKSDFYIINPIAMRGHVVSLINHPNKYKDTRTGLKALEIVHASFPDLKVIFFGNFEPPENLPTYIYYIQKANIKTLRERIYNQSSIFLFTSILEGWGLVATEAMASGAALVSTRNGGVDDFGIENQTALLNDVGDYQGLADSIISLFNDNSKRIRIATNGAKLVQSLTFKSSAQKFENVLLEIVRKAKHNG